MALSSTLQAAPWAEVGVTCLRLVESKAGAGDHNCVAQKAPEGVHKTDDTHTILPLYDDIYFSFI